MGRGPSVEGFSVYMGYVSQTGHKNYQEPIMISSSEIRPNYQFFFFWNWVNFLLATFIIHQEQTIEPTLYGTESKTHNLFKMCLLRKTKIKQTQMSPRMSPLVFHRSNMPGGGGYSLILAIHTAVCAAPNARVLGFFGYTLCPLGLESGMIFEETTGVYKCSHRLNSD